MCVPVGMVDVTGRCLGTLVALTAVIAAIPTADGSAAIYWGHSRVIGRANNDGSEALTKTQGFIGNTWTPYLGSSCGVAVDDKYVYWADSDWDRIGRATLDGYTELDFDFIDGAEEPCGVAVDDDHIYWANRGGNSIGRARLSGGGVDQDYVAAATKPCGVAVDDDFVYWAGAVTRVGRALLDGGAKGPPLVEDGEEEVGESCGVAVKGDDLFWGGYGDSIGRVGTDGSEPDPGFIDGVDRPCGLTIYDSRLYWSEGFAPGRISSSRLSGSDLDRGVVEGISALRCGSIAVDPLGALAPPPQPAQVPPPCTIERVRLNTRRGVAFARLLAPFRGRIRVHTRGLRWRVLGQEPSTNANPTERRWIKLEPRERGGVARRIKRRLRRSGKARLQLRISCGAPPAAVAKRRIFLRMKRRPPRRNARAKRRASGYRAARGAARG